MPSFIKLNAKLLIVLLRKISEAWILALLILTTPLTASIVARGWEIRRMGTRGGLRGRGCPYFLSSSASASEVPSLIQRCNDG